MSHPLSLLTLDATPAQLIRAAAANHTSWFTTCALAAGGEVCREHGAEWVCTPGPDGEVVIPFPRIPEARQGAVLDRILAYCRERGDLRSVSCWTTTPRGPRGLGARLAARGFEYGWQAHWMGMDLSTLPADLPLPDGLRIVEGDFGEAEAQEDLPYYSRGSAAILLSQANAEPRRTWRFGALREGKVVGHVSLHVTTGRLGAAGIYNMGVVPSARNQGIGRSLMDAACRHSREMGCHHAVLNSAASEFYYRLGWKSLGYGQTWWLHAATLAAPPPTPAQIAFAEAVGLGDISALDEAAKRGETPDDLNAPLPNGMTPMALAIQARKPACARWLIASGATLDVFDAWALGWGWRKRAGQMLRASPEFVNRRSGPIGLTPLHEAVSRGDVDLVRLLLTVHPDLSIRDTAHNATPLDWARYFRRPDLIALLEEYQAAQGA